MRTLLLTMLSAVTVQAADDARFGTDKGWSGDTRGSPLIELLIVP